MAELEPGAVYRALQEVDEGADVAEVYASLMNDAGYAEEDIENDLHDAAEEAHDFPECREKYQRTGFCMGTTCRHLPGMILTVDCPCKCHAAEMEGWGE